MALAIQVRNSFWYGKYQNSLNIYREFADSFPKFTFHKLVQNHFFQGFLWIIKFSENCPETHKELPRKVLTSFIKSIVPSFIPFITFRNFQRI